ncbi:MAG: hypothetical protein GF379_02205, partial [Candidatus Omnitrophica bacterium]|nr:hypothetical protein [Candidatus Omnitrophota bacterium]
MEGEELKALLSLKPFLADVDLDCIRNRLDLTFILQHIREAILITMSTSPTHFCEHFVDQVSAIKDGIYLIERLSSLRKGETLTSYRTFTGCSRLVSKSGGHSGELSRRFYRKIIAEVQTLARHSDQVPAALWLMNEGIRQNRYSAGDIFYLWNQLLEFVPSKEVSPDNPCIVMAKELLRFSGSGVFDGQETVLEEMVQGLYKRLRYQPLSVRLHVRIILTELWTLPQFSGFADAEAELSGIVRELEKIDEKGVTFSNLIIETARAAVFLKDEKYKQIIEELRRVTFLIPSFEEGGKRYLRTITLHTLVRLESSEEKETKRHIACLKRQDARGGSVSVFERLEYLIYCIFFYKDGEQENLAELIDILSSQDNPVRQDRLVKFALSRITLHMKTSSTLKDTFPLFEAIRKIVAESRENFTFQTEFEYEWFEFMVKIKRSNKWTSGEESLSLWNKLAAVNPDGRRKFLLRLLEVLRTYPDYFAEFPYDYLPVVAEDRDGKEQTLPYNRKGVLAFHFIQAALSISVFLIISSSLLSVFSLPLLIAGLVLLVMDLRESNYPLTASSVYRSLFAVEFFALGVLGVLFAPFSAVYWIVLACFLVLALGVLLGNPFSPYVSATLGYSLGIKVICWAVLLLTGTTSGAVFVLIVVSGTAGFFTIRDKIPQRAFRLVRRGFSLSLASCDELSNLWDTVFVVGEDRDSPEIDRAWVNDKPVQEVVTEAVHPQVELSRLFYSQIRQAVLKRLASAGLSARRLDIFDLDILHRTALGCVKELNIPFNGGFSDQIVSQAVHRLKKRLEGTTTQTQLLLSDNDLVSKIINYILEDRQLLLNSISLRAAGMPQIPFVDYLAHNALLTAQPHLEEPRRAVLRDKISSEELRIYLSSQLDIDESFWLQLPGLLTSLGRYKGEDTGATLSLEEIDSGFRRHLEEHPGHRDVAANNLRVFAHGQFSHSRLYTIVELVRNALHAMRYNPVPEQKVEVTIKPHYACVEDHGGGIDLGELDELAEVLTANDIDINWLNADLLSFTSTGGKKFLEIAENFGLGFFSTFSQLLAEGDRVVAQSFVHPGRKGWRFVVERVNFGTAEKPDCRDMITLARIPAKGCRGTRIEVFSEVDGNEIEKLMKVKFRYHPQGEIVLNGEVLNSRMSEGLMETVAVCRDQREVSMLYLRSPPQPSAEIEQRQITVTIDGLSILSFNLPGRYGPKEIVLTLPSNTEVNLARQQLSTIDERVSGYLKSLIAELEAKTHGEFWIGELFPVAKYIDELLSPLRTHGENTLTDEIIFALSSSLKDTAVLLPNTLALAQLSVTPGDDAGSFFLKDIQSPSEVQFVHPQVWKKMPLSYRNLPFDNYSFWLPSPFGGTHALVIPTQDLDQEYSYREYRAHEHTRFVTRFSNIIFVSNQFIESSSGHREAIIRLLFKLHNARGIFIPERFSSLLGRCFGRVEDFISSLKLPSLELPGIKTKKEHKKSGGDNTETGYLSPLARDKYEHKTTFPELILRFHGNNQEQLKFTAGQLREGLVTRDPLREFYQQITLSLEEPVSVQLEELSDYFSLPQNLITLYGTDDETSEYVLRRWCQFQKEIIEDALAAFEDGLITVNEVKDFISYFLDFGDTLSFQHKIKELFKHTRRVPQGRALHIVLWRQCRLFRHMRPRDCRQTLNVSTYAQNITDLLLWMREYFQNQLDAILAATEKEGVVGKAASEYRIRVPREGKGAVFNSSLPIPPNVLFNAWLVPLVSRGKSEGYRGDKGHGVFMSFRSAGYIYIKTSIPGADGDVLYVRIKFVRNSRRIDWEKTFISYTVCYEPGFSGHMIHWIPAENLHSQRPITQSDLRNAVYRYGHTILWEEMKIRLSRMPLKGWLGRISFWQPVNRFQKYDVSSLTKITVDADSQLDNHARTIEEDIRLLVGRRRGILLGNKIREITSASLKFKTLSDQGLEDDGREFFRGLHPEFWDFLWERGFSLDIGPALKLTADRTELARQDEPEIVNTLNHAAVLLSINVFLNYFARREVSLRMFPGGVSRVIEGLATLLENPDSEITRKIISDVACFYDSASGEVDFNRASGSQSELSERLDFYNSPEGSAMFLCMLPFFNGRSLYEIFNREEGRISLVSAAVAVKNPVILAGLFRHRKQLSPYIKGNNFKELRKALTGLIWSQRELILLMFFLFGTFLDEMIIFITSFSSHLPVFVNSVFNFTIWGMGTIKVAVLGEVFYISVGIVAVTLAVLVSAAIISSRLVNKISARSPKNLLLYRHKWLLLTGVLVLVWGAMVFKLSSCVSNYDLPWDRIIIDDMLINLWEKVYPLLFLIYDRGVGLLKDIWSGILDLSEKPKSNGDMSLMVTRMLSLAIQSYVFPAFIIVVCLFTLIRRIRAVFKRRYPEGIVWVDEVLSRDSIDSDPYCTYGQWYAGLLGILGYRRLRVGFFADTGDLPVRLKQESLLVNLHTAHRSVSEFAQKPERKTYQRTYGLVREIVGEDLTSSAAHNAEQAALEYLVLREDEVFDLEDDLREACLNVDLPASSSGWLENNLERIPHSAADRISLKRFILRILGLEYLWSRIPPNPAYRGLPRLHQPSRDEWINHLSSLYPFIVVNGEAVALSEYIESQEMSREELEAVKLALEEASIKRTLTLWSAKVVPDVSLRERITGFFDLVSLARRLIVLVLSWSLNIAFGPWIARFAYLAVYRKRNILKKDFSSIFIGALRAYRAQEERIELSKTLKTSGSEYSSLTGKIIEELPLDAGEKEKLNGATSDFINSYPKPVWEPVNHRSDELTGGIFAFILLRIPEALYRYIREKLTFPQARRRFYTMIEELSLRYPQAGFQLKSLVRRAEYLQQSNRGTAYKGKVMLHQGWRGVVMRLLSPFSAILGGAWDQLKRRGKLFLYGIVGVATAAGIAIGSPVITGLAKMILIITAALILYNLIRGILIYRRLKEKSTLYDFGRYCLFKILPLSGWAIVSFLIAAEYPVLEIGKVFMLPSIPFVSLLPFIGEYLNAAITSTSVDAVGVALFVTAFVVFLSTLDTFVEQYKQVILAESSGRRLNYRHLTDVEISSANDYLLYNIMVGVSDRQILDQMREIQAVVQMGEIPFLCSEREYRLWQLNCSLEEYFSSSAGSSNLRTYCESAAQYSPDSRYREIMVTVFLGMVKGVLQTLSSWRFFWISVKSTFMIWSISILGRLFYSAIPWSLDRGIENLVSGTGEGRVEVNLFENVGWAIEAPGDATAAFFGWFDYRSGLNLGRGIFRILGGDGNPQTVLATTMQRCALRDVPLWRINMYGDLYTALTTFESNRSSGLIQQTLNIEEGTYMDAETQLLQYVYSQGAWLSPQNIEEALENILTLGPEAQNPYRGLIGSGRLLYTDKVRAARILRAIGSPDIVELPTGDIGQFPDIEGFDFQSCIDEEDLSYTGQPRWMITQFPNGKWFLADLHDPVQYDFARGFSLTESDMYLRGSGGPRFQMHHRPYIYYLLENQVPIVFSSSVHSGALNGARWAQFASYEMVRRSLYELNGEEPPMIFYLFDRFRSAAADAWPLVSVIRFNPDRVAAHSHEHGHILDGNDGIFGGEIYITDESGHMYDLMDIELFNWLLQKDENVRAVMERWGHGYGDFSNYLSNHPEQSLGSLGAIERNLIAADAHGSREFYANLNALLTFPQESLTLMADPTEPASMFLRLAAIHFRRRNHGLIILSEEGGNNTFFGMPFSAQMQELFPDEEIGKHYALAWLINDLESYTPQVISGELNELLIADDIQRYIGEVSDISDLSEADVALLLVETIFAQSSRDSGSSYDMDLGEEFANLNREDFLDLAATLARSAPPSTDGDVHLPLIFWKWRLETLTDDSADNMWSARPASELSGQMVREAYSTINFFNGIIDAVENGREIDAVFISGYGESPPSFALLPTNFSLQATAILLRNLSVEDLGPWLVPTGNWDILYSRFRHILSSDYNYRDSDPFREDRKLLYDFFEIENTYREYLENGNSFEDIDVPVLNLSLLFDSGLEASGAPSFADNGFSEDILRYLYTLPEEEFSSWVNSESSNTDFLQEEMPERFGAHPFSAAGQMMAMIFCYLCMQFKAAKVFLRSLYLTYTLALKVLLDKQGAGEISFIRLLFSYRVTLLIKALFFAPAERSPGGRIVWKVPQETITNILPGEDSHFLISQIIIHEQGKSEWEGLRLQRRSILTSKSGGHGEKRSVSIVLKKEEDEVGMPELFVLRVAHQISQRFPGRKIYLILRDSDSMQRVQQIKDFYLLEANISILEEGDLKQWPHSSITFYYCPNPDFHEVEVADLQGEIFYLERGFDQFILPRSVSSLRFGFSQESSGIIFDERARNLGEEYWAKRGDNGLMRARKNTILDKAKGYSPFILDRLGLDFSDAFWSACYVPDSQADLVTHTGKIRDYSKNIGFGKKKVIFTFLDSEEFSSLCLRFKRKLEGINLIDSSAETVINRKEASQIFLVNLGWQNINCFAQLIAFSDLPVLVGRTNSLIFALSAGKTFLYVDPFWQRNLMPRLEERIKRAEFAHSSLLLENRWISGHFNPDDSIYFDPAAAIAFRQMSLFFQEQLDYLDGMVRLVEEKEKGRIISKSGGHDLRHRLEKTTAPLAAAYQYISIRQRGILADAQTYEEIFLGEILPDLKERYRAYLKGEISGVPVGLLLVAGGGGSAKTSVSRWFLKVVSGGGSRTELSVAYSLQKEKRAELEERLSGRRGLSLEGAVINWFREIAAMDSSKLSSEVGVLPEDIFYLLSFDRYILQKSDRPVDSLTGKKTENPFKKFQVERFINDMKRLLSGEVIYVPVFDFKERGRLKIGREEATPVIVDNSRIITIVEEAGEVYLSDGESRGKVLTLNGINISLEKKGEDISVFIEGTEHIIRFYGKSTPQAVEIEGAVTRFDETETGLIEVVERVDPEGRIFIVEGILSLASKALNQKADSVFIDADFWARLLRMLVRFKGETGRGENKEQFVEKRLTLRQTEEMPYIMPTRELSRHKASTQTRSESILVWFIEGKLDNPDLLSTDERKVFDELRIKPFELAEELRRVSLREIRRRIKTGGITAHAIGSSFWVFYLEGRLVIKVAKDSFKAASKEFL